MSEDLKKQIEILRPKQIFAEGINPKILIWARKTRGWSLEEASNKINIAISTLEGSEKGNKKLTMRQLRIICEKYKRPLSVFYFDELPEDISFPDFRTLLFSDVDNGDLNVRIRELLMYQQIARELSTKSHNYDFIGSFTHKDSDHTITSWMKNKFETTWKIFGKKKDNDVLKIWIDEIEKLGILVFQFNNIDREITRGLSISSIPYPVIALNSKDTHYARIFTLFHEFVHLLISSHGICSSSNTVNMGIEKKCDGIAAEFLLPLNSS